MVNTANGFAQNQIDRKHPCFFERTLPVNKLIFTLAGIILLTAAFSSAQSQTPVFTHQDTLRGTITPERIWWDLNYYHLDIKVDPKDKTITGQNMIQYKVLEPGQIMQIDLQPPLEMGKVTQNNIPLKVRKDGNAHFIELTEKQIPGSVNRVIVQYGGEPQVSRRPPWSGGVTWKKDNNGIDFIATANQGDGASLWWPCKDNPYDEPDSILMSINVPGHLTDVSNGRLRGVDNLKDGTRTFHWFVSNPINHYGVNINIGDYVHFSEVYQGEKGPLDCDYWVLKDNLAKAKVHFKEVPRMLTAFEHWFGPYPFYEDSYKLVEAPYLGMEHQSSVTYGNGYKNGYQGTDLSNSGWGLKFDFIIVHESGHEWFANNITNRDAADMWIHEAFIAYSENLFLNYFYGKEASAAYVLGTRAKIRNDRPIVGIFNVNYSGSGDMYYKGSNMLHTLRQLINDDEKWRSILRGLNSEFYHQTVTGDQIESYIIEKSGLDLKTFFDQYVRDVKIPVLEYYIKDNVLSYRWSNCVRRFNMPLQVTVNGEEKWLKPTQRWQKLKLDVPVKSFVVDPDYYAASFNIYGEK
ncbi:M1 family metallopeptidase [candidate division KSB1 bacterium]